MSGCENARDLIATHVTSGLDGEEARLLLEHLAGCPACSEYLRELARAVHLLPYGLPLVPPPAHLKERVLRAVREAGAQGEAARAAERPGRRPAWLLPAAAAVLLALQVGLAALGFAEYRRLSAGLDAARRQVAAAATVLGEGSLQPAWILRMIREEGFHRAWGHATLFRTRYGDVLVLALGGLPPAEGEGVYRVWLLAGDRRDDGGSFEPDAAGFASLAIQRPEFAYDAVGVTLEPDARPSAVPRGPRVLFLNLAARPGSAD